MGVAWGGRTPPPPRPFPKPMLDAVLQPDMCQAQKCRPQEYTGILQPDDIEIMPGLHIYIYVYVYTYIYIHIWTYTYCEFFFRRTPEDLGARPPGLEVEAGPIPPSWHPRSHQSSKSPMSTVDIIMNTPYDYDDDDVAIVVFIIDATAIMRMVVSFYDDYHYA